VDSTRPDDLVPIRDAARMVDRGYSTLRGWVRSGDLTGYYADPERPSNSPLLVSKQELLTLMAAANKVPNPPRPPSTKPDAASPSARDDLRLELARAHAELATARAERDGALAVAEALRGTISALQERCRDLTERVEAEHARAVAAEADLQVLRVDRRLPWWRRLLGGPPALPDRGDGG
jgi:hypothetical protein